MSTIDVLKNFIEDIDKAKTSDRETVMIELITTRLDKTLDSYITTLNKDIKYLTFRNSLNLAKRLNK